MKRCSKCKEQKHLHEFSKNASEKDGKQRHCRMCRRDAYFQNREKIIENQKKRYDPIKKAEYDKVRRIEKSEKIRAYDRKRAKDAKRIEANKKQTSIRRAAMKARIPSWFGELDKFVLQEAYELTFIRKQATKIAWHVDHIEPLCGKDICGLHTAHNIQVIPATLNVRINNRRKTPAIAGVT